MEVFKKMFTKTSKSVCASTVGVSCDHWFPTPSPSSAMKTPENTEENPDDPDPADKGDIIDIQVLGYFPEKILGQYGYHLTSWINGILLYFSSPLHTKCYPTHLNLLHIMSPIIL
jgi:hypothetical protein